MEKILVPLLFSIENRSAFAAPAQESFNIKVNAALVTTDVTVIGDMTGCSFEPVNS
jgi:hypothetical protein